MKKILFAILALALIVTVAPSCCPNSCEAKEQPAPASAPVVEQMYQVAEGPDFKVYVTVVNGDWIYVVSRVGGAVSISTQ